ncbi:SDR family NAD(P)-dependent oxidoreductase [Sphingomonas mali]|uniref:SDR family NAD(P)-dependent oxidoreductase n=1 Tax=Sphingomonas mali TaxID=40682 RepID=UPI00082BDAA3|nr:SDR family oxidoreductase [Sphingomonas mali]
MDLRLDGKRALVTGSSSGIGEAIAHYLAKEGATVVVHGRNAERTRAVAAAINDAGGISHAVTGDLTDDASVSALVATIEREVGGIDILVNNAGGRPKGFARDGWLGQGSDAWLDTYKLNVIATVRLIDTLAPGMIERGWGRCIQIASAVALHQPPNFPDYQAAKAAEINLSRSLSRSMAGTGVTANSISAGIIHSPGSENELQGIVQELKLAERWQDVERTLALDIFRQSAGRVGRGDDIAATVAFLASPVADFITGTNIVVDGGI